MRMRTISFAQKLVSLPEVLQAEDMEQKLVKPLKQVVF